MFKTDLFPTQHYENWIVNDIRYYKIADDFIVPSVTSVISQTPFFDQSWLAEWRNAVGKVQADKISTKAKNRGKALHAMAEKYIKGEDYKKKANPVTLSEFIPIRKVLDQNVDNIRGVEITLYSKDLTTAGTSDLIADWKGKLSIIDYKTKRYKSFQNVTSDDIIDYFVQESCYAYMCNEMYSVNIEDIVIIMAPEHAEPLIFEQKVSDYKDLMVKIFSKENRII